jgi:hypothetical protein
LDNPFDAVRRAVSEARDINRAVESVAYAMSEMLAPHLRHASCGALADIKAQLRNFDSRTGKWRK